MGGRLSPEASGFYHRNNSEVSLLTAPRTRSESVLKPKTKGKFKVRFIERADCVVAADVRPAHSGQKHRLVSN